MGMAHIAGLDEMMGIKGLIRSRATAKVGMHREQTSGELTAPNGRGLVIGARHQGLGLEQRRIINGLRRGSGGPLDGALIVGTVHDGGLLDLVVVVGAGHRLGAGGSESERNRGDRGTVTGGDELVGAPRDDGKEVGLEETG